MLTRSAKNLMACVPLASGAYCSLLQVTGVDGVPYFLYQGFYSTYYPSGKSESFTASATSAGISLGTDDTPATENDYNLGNTITDGISMTVSNKAVTFVDGQPALKYMLTVTNTGAEAVNVREVGIKQNVQCDTYPGHIASSTPSSAHIVLIDRTVLDAPVTIQPGDAAAIEYSLIASPSVKTVGGVECASFQTATDAQIAAMIDAARQGTIDLQADCGWAVGDVRSIHVDAWTGGNNVAHAAEDLEIVITAFGDYMNCGCLFQFDFMECCTAKQRMNSSNTNVGGYGSTEMYTTTLPALVNALPEWLRTRLKTFDVLASAGSGSTTIETVSGNKLALRSEVELFGLTSLSAAGEGSHVEYYKRGTAVRTKRTGQGGSTNIWWERSPLLSGGTSGFCNVSNTGTASGTNAGTAYGLSPFGCI